MARRCWPPRGSSRAEIGALLSDWHGFNVLHTAAARVGALDLGFLPGAGGKAMDAMLAGGVDLLWLLGADEFDTGAIPAGCFVVYQGHHGDRGAARADVILPGAAYTEKSGTYVNTEGRVQRGFAATHPPGEAREDWKILRAFSQTIGLPLPYDDLPALRARLEQVNPVFGRIGFLPRFGMHRPLRPGRRSHHAVGARRSSRRWPTTTSPIRSAAPARRWRSAPPSMTRARAGGRVARMDGFWQTDGGHLLLVFIQALALLVPLLIGVAYLTYAERKVLAAIQLRKGPNVVGPFGLWQPFADALKMLMKETIIPTGSNRLLFLMAPMLTFALAMLAWAVIPVNEGWAIADINVGILYLFAISSLGVYGIIIAGWASNSKYAFLGALRSAAQMVSYEVSMGFVIVTRHAVRRQPEPDRHRDGAADTCGSACRCSRCSSSSSSRRWPNATARPSICRKARARSSPASSSNTAP